MLTVPNDVASPACEADDATPGDPDCGFAAAAPGLHVCTDRDGVVVSATSDKACFAWARSQVLRRRCERCDEFVDAAGAVPSGLALCLHCEDGLEFAAARQRYCDERCAGDYHVCRSFALVWHGCVAGGEAA